jgi:hypothetical protein
MSPYEHPTHCAAIEVSHFHGKSNDPQRRTGYFPSVRLQNNNSHGENGWATVILAARICSYPAHMFPETIAK